MIGQVRTLGRSTRKKNQSITDKMGTVARPTSTMATGAMAIAKPKNVVCEIWLSTKMLKLHLLSASCFIAFALPPIINLIEKQTISERLACHAKISPPSRSDQRIKRLSGVNKNTSAKANKIPRLNVLYCPSIKHSYALSCPSCD